MKRPPARRRSPQAAAPAAWQGRRRALMPSLQMTALLRTRAERGGSSLQRFGWQRVQKRTIKPARQR